MIYIALIACLISLGLVIQMFVAVAKFNKAVKKFDKMFCADFRKGKNLKKASLVF